MGRYVFKLPDVGEGTAEAELTQWHVAVGEHIEEDQPLADVATDKAVVEIPSPVSGKVVALNGAAGDRIAVGSELVVFETEPALAVEEAAAAAAAPVDAPAAAGAASKALAATPSSRALAAPAVRQRARALGVELALVQGSGPEGRVTHADLDAHFGPRAGQRGEKQQRVEKEQGEEDRVEEIRIVGVRRKIAERMQEAKRRIPHFSYIEEVDVTALEALRGELNRELGERRGRLTPLAFLMRALARAVSAHPEMNARFDDEQGVVQRHAAVHLGIATQTPHGLVVPVVRHAQRLDLWQCAEQASRLAAAAREGRATRDELSGSTITITSLGALGGIASTPVINTPEVAIVGVNRIMERAVVLEGRIVVRRMMNLSSSFDHRVIDGWNAAAFIQRIKGLLEQPALLLVNA